MNNIKYGLRVASTILLITLLISTSVSAIAERDLTKYQNNNLSKISDQSRGKFVSVIRGWAVGNATSGKVIGFSGNIAKINFEYLSITKLKFFPPRWETANFWNTSAIIFNLNQTIPQGPFDLEEDWVVAVIFKI